MSLDGDKQLFPGSVFAKRICSGATNSHLWAVLDLVDKGELDVSPPYQRGLVWTLQQKQDLIDTMTMGLNIPAIYVREREDVHEGAWMEVVDGKQRISTIKEFMSDGFAFQGKLYSQWLNRDRDVFRGLFISVVHLVYASDEDVRTVYERINFNGTPHERA